MPPSAKFLLPGHDTIYVYTTSRADLDAGRNNRPCVCAHTGNKIFNKLWKKKTTRYAREQTSGTSVRELRFEEKRNNKILDEEIRVFHDFAVGSAPALSVTVSTCVISHRRPVLSQKLPHNYVHKSGSSS